MRRIGVWGRRKKGKSRAHIFEKNVKEKWEGEKNKYPSMVRQAEVLGFSLPKPFSSWTRTR